MNTTKAICLLETLLGAEVDAGRPPGVAPQGIFDGPKQIVDLINQIKAQADGGECITQSLIGSVWGGVFRTG